MKRIFVFAVATLVAVGSVFADEKSLIDFSLLKADIDEKEVPGNGVLDADGNPVHTTNFTQNEATLMDFANQAGAFATDEQKASMRTSLAIENWDVVFTSSARTLENKRLSYTREAPSAAYDTVMGVRIHFPAEAYNSSAQIVPPFPIPGFDQAGDESTKTPYAPASRFKPVENGDRTADGGKGIIYNVGTIKSVVAEVYGLNFPHKLSIILIDHLGNEKIIPMGNLNYEGWGKLTWNNPQYVGDVRNRELRLYPIYPQSQTFVRFGGFIVQKDASAPGGDFIGYFKEVRVIYDQAVLETDTPRDIDDESIWEIITDRESSQNRTDMLQFGNNSVQQYLDSARQAPENYPYAYPTGRASGAAGGEASADEQ
ncbi:MAG: flagellar filament outer layer protein FlaA [Treponema sp.]|nr:flagellar filament outer layer protein FlaA [Treponema sp.]